MMIKITEWAETLRGLGDSFLAVWRAELEALKSDLRSSAKLAVRAGLVFAGAYLLAFWFIGVVLAALIALLGKSVGYWQAGLIVGVGLLILTALLWFWARSLLRRVQGPKATAQARLEDHVEWVKGELASTEPDSGGEDEPGGA